MVIAAARSFHYDERSLGQYGAAEHGVKAAEGVRVFLPRGVTGMASRQEGSPSLTDFRAFRSHCYAVARVAGWSVREVSAPRQAIACNYALAVLAFRDSRIAVVVNAVFPLLAFATPPAEWQVELDFADRPELGATFEQFGYTVLLAAELDRPLTRDMWQGLAPHEQEDVQYFRPPRVGDAIYNLWD